MDKIQRALLTVAKAARARFVEDPTLSTMQPEDASWLSRQFRRVIDALDMVIDALTEVGESVGEVDDKLQLHLYDFQDPHKTYTFISAIPDPFPQYIDADELQPTIDLLATHTHDGTETAKLFSGGLANMVIQKSTDADYDYKWSYYSHEELTGKNSGIQHTQSAVSGRTATGTENSSLVQDQAAQDTELTRLGNDKLDTADALETFAFAAYISMASPVNISTPDLGSAWEEVTNPVANAPPLHLTEEANGRFSFDIPGMYALLVSGVFEHNSSNSGRTTNLRIYNYTTATESTSVQIPTGRNAEATTISVNLLVPIDGTQVGQIFGFQVGGGDTYTSVIINTFHYSIFSVGLSELAIGGP